MLDAGLTVLRTEQQIAHADVGSTVGLRAEQIGLQLTVRRRERQSVGIGELQRELPALRTREVVGEEQAEGDALVGGQRHTLAVQLHLRIHQRQRQPRVGTFHKLAVELQVEACCMSAGLVFAVVDHLHVVHAIGHEL